MKKNNRHVLIILLLLLSTLGIAIRLYLAWVTPGNYDMESYKIVTSIVEEKGNVYTETHRYNYSPFWFHVLLFLQNLADASNLPFEFVERSFLSIVDILIACVMYINTKKLIYSTIYLINPVSILIIGVHGQFDNLAMLPLLVAIGVVDKRLLNKRMLFSVWLLCTLSIIIKQTTLFAVLMFYVMACEKKRTAIILFSFSFLAFCSTFIPYALEAGKSVLMNVFFYFSVPFRYGLGSIFPRLYVTGLFFGIMLVLPFIIKDYFIVSVEKASGISLTAFLSLAPGVSEQYFIMPTIIAGLQPSLFYWIYTGIVTVFLLSSPNNLGIDWLPNSWNSVWVAVTAWFVFTLANARKKHIHNSHLIK